MKNKTSKNYSGIVICDSITMSVKKKRHDLRWLEAVFIALIGFVSVIMSFLEMFDFNYSLSTVVRAAVIFSAFYIFITLTGKKTLWFVGASFLILSVSVYKFSSPIIKGFKYVYNVIYSTSLHTEIKYYKFLDPDYEKHCVTIFFVFCIWLLALVIYTFTIHRANPIIVIIFTFPIIEVGLYNGISIPVFWGILTIAYWLALLAICNIDLGEYSGGSSGFVRKGNLFFPKRQMRLKVTEKCAVIIIASVCAVTAASLAVMKLTGYRRSEELNQKRIDIKEAVSAFTFDDLASSISAVTESFGFTINYESHKLGTSASIKYKNVTDLVVTLDKKYEGAVYLKGYAGAVYKNNEWLDLDKSAYKNADALFDDFEKYGIYPQDFPHIFSEEAFNENADITLWLEAKRKKNKSYAPYGTNNYGDMEYNEDSTVSSKKNGKNDYSYKFTGIDAWNVSMLLDVKGHSVFSVGNITDPSWQQQINDYCSENDLFSYNDNFAIDNELSPEYFSENDMYDNGSAIMAALLESRYRSFVYENYLQLPDDSNIKEIRSLFADILDSASTETASDKLELLQQLRDRVNSMTEYSLSPGKTPSNRDFVNYFLLESHKGYCTHYASTGVLLARMAGIPARYATGYIVVGDDFSDKTQNEDGTYTIELKDNRSHAWVEIYLDGFGWVPFEFTAGYSSMTINTNTTTTANTTSTEVSTTTVKNANTSTSDKSKKTTSSRGTETSTTTKTTQTTTSVPGAKQSENDSFVNSKISVVILIAAGLITVILLIYLRRYIIIRCRKKSFSSGSDAKRIRYMYEYMEKLLSVLKIRKGSMQYIEFADLTEEKLSPEYFPSGDFRRFIDLALQCSFGNTSPENSAAEFAMRFTETLGKSIYKKSGFLKQIYMRLIIVLI